MILLLSTLAVGGCDPVALDVLAQTEAPAVLVLGERHGQRDELRLAAELVERLGERAPVTVALEAVHGDRQDAADAFAEHGRRGRLKRGLAWKETWGYRFGVYWPVLRQGRDGVRLVGAGLDLGPAPAGQAIAIPDGYEEQLADAMAGHDMPPDVEARFTRSMAWRDLRIAQQAVDGWNQEGFLVIVTGRGHVEGGRGVTWQLRRLTHAPILPALLAAEDATCPADTPVLVQELP